ncbi:restriction endonuclease subunit S [Sporomusa acidovorans]|uniref:Type I restriction modification DNA specificity domain-containing protein n=1 Tax=Sporomusa acidovorans (strain ATCC 49682 / DSM 3132 / Mol) TaxID=1123286 RepID=A0ABZ3JBW5_SPOA4|nr:restriction endonuclease subunit S [Sporomusa acidovorans]OZC17006.1 type-1 restriction enzyme EcoKI specificity protein [Sporomusa acidovorans DSM 3132]SDF33863.1 type I restriction enzyme, S subunit [Sporomusa acidovorans]
MCCNGWRENTLGQVYEFSSGLSKNAKEFGFGFPFLSFKTVFNNYFIPEEICDLANTTEKEREKCSVKKGDVFLTRTSESLDELGMSCVALKDYQQATFNGFTKRLRPKNPEIINPKFTGYYFRSPRFRLAVTSMASMTTRASLNNDMLSRLPILIPPISEQVAIADILYSLDKKIELNNRINKILEEMAQAIFKSWFVGFEPFQEEEFEDSELGRIPKGWRVGTVSDLGDVIGGSTPSKSKSEYYTDQGIAWITPKDLSINKDKFISKGEIDITESGLKNSSAKIMPKGTVLFSSRAPIGYIAIAKNDVATNQGFKSVVPKNNIGTAYVYYFLKNNIEVIENRATGSTFKEVSGAIMKQIPAIIPNDKILSEFQSMCDLYFNKQLLLEEQNQNLTAIRNSLLPKLISGEIRVPLEEVQ